MNALLPTGTARAASAGPVESPLPPSLVEAVRSLELSEALLARAYELARCAGSHDPARFQGALLLSTAMLQSLELGSTALPLDPGGPLDRQLDRLGASEHERRQARRLLAEPSPLVGGPGDFRPLIMTEGWLAWHKFDALERLIAERLRERLALPRRPTEVSRLDPILGAAHPHPLSTEQREAVRAAVERPLTLITGGPGTGKTSIVSALLRALATQGAAPHEIALAAPTGKAAHRLEETLEPGLAAAPRTLHRLLEMSAHGRRLRRNRANPLAEKHVIVDECSMIDAAMMAALLDAVGPETQLILLGDAEQLPSVEAGSVFRDLLHAPALAPEAFRLTRSFRLNESDPAGRAILSAAREINAGRGDGIPEVAAPRFEGIERLSGGTGLPRAFLDRWFDEVLEQGARSEKGQLLAITRETPGSGSDALNDYLSMRLRRLRGGVGPFVPGEPVLMLRNDYGRGLFNGDRGVVIEDGRQRAVVFPGERVFPLEGLHRELERAWAVTVHKAQGSEYERVALVLPDRPIPLLTREILYTAITRARSSVTLVGRAEVLAYGVAQKIERWSSLGSRLG